MSQLGLVSNAHCPHCKEDIDTTFNLQNCPKCNAELNPKAVVSRSKNSAMLWIVGVIAFGLIGRFVGGYIGRFTAEMENRKEAKVVSTNQSPVPLNPPVTDKSPALLPQDPNYQTLKLPLGVTIAVPKSWRDLSDVNESIETMASQLDRSGVALPKGKKVNLFRANSMPRTTYAGIAVNATDSELDPAEVQNASDAEIEALTPEMRKVFEEEFSGTVQILEFSAVRREFVGIHPALVIAYKRTGPQGPVVVEMTRLFLGQKEISLNLSYRESEAEKWKPVVLYIRQSLKVS